MTRSKRRLGFIITLIGMTAVALAVVFWPSDVDRLHGAWIGGSGRITFDGTLVVLDGPVPKRTYFRLDSRASPKRITVWDADAPTLFRQRYLGVEIGMPAALGPEWEMHGLYELDGDRLRLCIPPPGADFPTGFDPAAGAVLEFRRE